MLPKHPVLAAELLRRRNADQAVRLRRPLDGEEIRRVDTDNTAFLKAVIAEHGWPGHCLVGEEAASAAWLSAQHADQDAAFQRQALTLLTAAVEAGDAARHDLALLTDRCLVANGRPQVYGSQFEQTTGGFGRARSRTPEESTSGAGAWGFRRSPSTRPSWKRCGPRPDRPIAGRRRRTGGGASLSVGARIITPMLRDLDRGGGPTALRGGRVRSGRPGPLPRHEQVVAAARHRTACVHASMAPMVSVSPSNALWFRAADVPVA
ncbi:DUF6624 domain-containing protein [Streptomyces sp. NPDC005389]|uniref:DUF6624 domain-containing protein n=1 Tax=Streptomyces sp. NPDC005389 TaxID=3157040 RepID=UPI0033A557FB